MDSISKLSHYIISKHTYFLESKEVGKKMHTIVCDERGKFEVPYSPLKIVKNSCKANGSHYDICLGQSKDLLRDTQRHKLPIVVGSDFGKPLILFPLFSPESKANIWIVYNNVLKYNSFDNISIVFRNNHKVDLPIQKITILQQLSSSRALETLITKMWKENELHFL